MTTRLVAAPDSPIACVTFSSCPALPSGRGPGSAPSVQSRPVGHEHGLRCLVSHPGPFQAQSPDSRTNAPLLLPRTTTGNWLSPPPPWRVTNGTPAEVTGEPGELTEEDTNHCRCWGQPLSGRCIPTSYSGKKS